MGETLDTYAGRFEHWVDEQPDAVAVIADDVDALTYAELEDRANRRANAILDADPDGAYPILAMALEQTTDGIVTIVAAAKTGRTMVALDPNEPPARVAARLDRLDPAILVFREHQQDCLADLASDRRLLVRIEDIPDDATAERRSRIVDPDAIAMINFTSGTTGEPKAAPRTVLAVHEMTSRDVGEENEPGVRHAAVADFQWAAGWYSVRKALCTGGTVVLYPTRRRGPGDLVRFLAAHRVQQLAAVPSLVRAMFEADPITRLPDLRWVTFSGDILHRDLVIATFERMPPDGEITTSYGATELGGVAKLTMRRDTVPDGDIVPVGVPHERVGVEIEDPDASGVGRLIVVSKRGAPVGKESEVRDDSVEALPDGRWRHRTSDLGRMRPDGMLEICGRTPHMAKVRGQRIGVSEVEAALLAVPGVSDAGVGIHPDDPAGRLTAWWVPVAGSHLSVTDLRQQLRPRLPSFMIPAVFVTMPSLPRGTRGKLLRNELPPPGTDRPDLGYPFEAPRGTVEEAVARAFERCLGIDEVGRDDDLFDLGGDSLLAAEVMTRIADSLGRDLPLSVFVEASTPAELALRLAAADEASTDRMVVLQPEGERPTIYCIHGGGGQVLSMAALAQQLGPDRPFVGVQMVPRDKARRLFRVRRLAERYASEIASRQSGKPCIISGHSFGGVVAQEVSRLLIDRGVPVELCLLLDTGVPRRRLLARRRPASVDDDDVAVRTFKQVGYAVHALVGLKPTPARRHAERMVTAMWGARWHRLRSTPVPIVVMRASHRKGPAGMSEWSEHTSVGCCVVDVPGLHNTMLRPPFVDKLARLVNQQIEQTERDGDGRLQPV